MKIHKVWAENVRNIKKQVSFSPALEGVTVLYAPNEFGKTTLAEVVSTIIEREYSSNHGSLKLLQRADSASGPTMGMEFEIGGAVYWLEKTWLKGKNCILRKISPELVNYQVGEESESELSELIGENFDEVLWRIVQVSQGNSFDTFDSLTSIEESSSLQQAFDRATEGESSESDESFLQTLEKEYSEWFTDKGKARREKDSRGKFLVDKAAEQDELNRQIRILDQRLSDADMFEIESKAETESIDNLIKIQKIQLKEKELQSAKATVGLFNELSDSISSLVKEHPYVTTWDSAKFEEFRAVNAGYQAYKSLKSLRVSALKTFDFKVDSEESILSAGESREVPITSGLSIEIDELARLEFPSSSENSNLKKDHDRFNALRKELDVSTLPEASARDTKTKDWTRLRQELETLVSGSRFEEEKHRYAELMSEKELNPEEWKLALTHKKVSQEDLLQLTRETGKKEGRFTEIRSEGVLSQKNQTEAKVRTLKSEIEELELQRDGIALLRNTVIEYKEKKAVVYSEKFEEELNSLVSLIFPGKTKISVDSDFSISGRNQDGTVLAIEQLSVGAREQISFMSRLAIAQIASSEGPIPLILDDDLVSTDDRRLNAIGEILQRLTGLQVLIFTCHPERFMGIPHKKSINLEKTS